jgi:hypothetical protein
MVTLLGMGARHRASGQREHLINDVVGDDPTA